MNSHSLSARALHALAWVSSGMGALAVLRVISLLILARLIGPAEFGIFSAALVVVGIVSVVADLGVGYALIQRPTIGEREIRTAMTLAGCSGLVLFTALWLIADEIGRFFQQSQVPDLLRMLAFVFPLRSLSVPTDALLQRTLDFRKLARIDVAAYAFGNFVISVALAVAGFGVVALVAGFLGEALLRTALVLRASPQTLRFGVDGGAARELLGYGAGATLAKIANAVALQGDRVVIGRMLGTTVLGEYERAYQLMVMPANSLGQVVGRVLFPAMSRVQTSPASLRANYRRSLALTAVITLPVSVLFVILSPELVGVMLGPGWDRSVVALETLGAVLLFRASYKMSDELARACGAIWRQLWRQMVYAAAVLAGGVLGSRYGLSGASVGVALAIVLNFVLMTDLGRRLTGLTWRDVLSAHRPALLLAVASAAGCATGALLARTAGVGNLTTVLLAGGLAAMAVLGLAFGAPRLLGQDARWLLALIGSSVPEPFATLLRRLVARIG